MTTAVTDQLLPDLVVGSHAEGTTRLAVAAAIEHEHRGGERRARGRCHLPRRRAPGVSAKTTPDQRAPR